MFRRRGRRSIIPFFLVKLEMYAAFAFLHKFVTVFYFAFLFKHYQSDLGIDAKFVFHAVVLLLNLAMWSQDFLVECVFEKFQCPFIANGTLPAIVFGVGLNVRF